MRLTIVVPILNEESILDRHAREIHERLSRDFGNFDWRVVLVDNGSDDRTPEIAARLSATLPNVHFDRLSERGKGRAIRHGWERHPADVNVFMDADLATDLEALRPLVHAVVAGSDLAVGSRAHKDSIVRRTPLRRLLSFCFRTLLRMRLGTNVKDAPCGFKAVSGRVVREVMPKVGNHHWFFDTELLMRSERGGYRIAEVPVYWSERNPEGRVSRVGVARVSWQYIQEVERLRRELRG